ncbi:MAG: OadG family protein [Clostridia bacterium]|nr:OadG family protein [Clostridia bacterium]
MMVKLLTPGSLSLFTTDAETLTTMWQTVVLGIGMVFAVLAILWGVLSIFKLVFSPKASGSKKSATPLKHESKEAAASDSASQPDDTLQAVIAASIQAYQEEENQQLIAVITAAVSAYRAAEGSTGEFRVVSFKRASGGRAWNAKR